MLSEILKSHVRNILYVVFSQNDLSDHMNSCCKNCRKDNFTSLIFRTQIDGNVYVGRRKHRGFFFIFMKKIVVASHKMKIGLFSKMN